MGPRIGPKSIKIVPGRRLIFDAFSDLRFHRFFVRFGLQNELQNRRFFDSGSQSPTLQKPCFSLGFNRFLEVRSSRNPWKNDRKTNVFFACVSDPVLGRFLGDLGSQNSRKTFRNSIAWVFEKLRFCRSYANRWKFTGGNGARGFWLTYLGLRLIRSYLSIYLSIYLLICSSSP